MKSYINIDIALLILRVGIGIMFILHGYPKMMGGMEKWISLGSYGMGSIGIDFFPAFWGFMAAFSEFFGGLMILFGIYIRYFSILLFITMLVAINTHLSGGGCSGYCLYGMSLYNDHSRIYNYVYRQFLSVRCLKD